MNALRMQKTHWYPGPGPNSFMQMKMYVVSTKILYEIQDEHKMYPKTKRRKKKERGLKIFDIVYGDNENYSKNIKKNE